MDGCAADQSTILVRCGMSVRSIDTETAIV